MKRLPARWPTTRGGRDMMRSMIIIAAALSAALPLAALAQSSDDLKNAEKNPENVLIYGMGYSANRYSPLTQITKENVGKLVPTWSYSLSCLLYTSDAADDLL